MVIDLLEKKAISLGRHKRETNLTLDVMNE
jgi:hypothetical protein